MAEWITSIVEAMGYIGIAVLMFIENVFPPIPSELIMPMAGFAAARGDFTLVGAIIAGTVGSVLGQYPLYYLGAALGEARLKRLADRYGKWFTVSSADIDRASRWFRRRGPMTIFLCRLVPGIRSLISIPAGINHMNLVSFTLYSTAGMAIWAALLAIAGYELGANYHLVESWIGPWSKVIVAVVGLGIIGWLSYRIWHCRNRAPNAPDAAASTSTPSEDGSASTSAPGGRLAGDSSVRPGTQAGNAGHGEPALEETVAVGMGERETGPR